MRASREALPVFAHRAALLAALGEGSPSGACVIEGETGSGKTTQVAQYLLEVRGPPVRCSFGSCSNQSRNAVCLR